MPCPLSQSPRVLFSRSLHFLNQLEHRRKQNIINRLIFFAALNLRLKSSISKIDIIHMYETDHSAVFSFDTCGSYKKGTTCDNVFFLIQTNSYRYQDPIIRCLSKATKFKATQMFWESHVASGHEK